MREISPFAPLTPILPGGQSLIAGGGPESRVGQRLLSISSQAGKLRRAALREVQQVGWNGGAPGAAGLIALDLGLQLRHQSALLYRLKSSGLKINASQSPSLVIEISLPGWPLLVEASKARRRWGRRGWGEWRTKLNTLLSEFEKEPRAVWEDSGDFQIDRGLKARPT